MIYKSPWKILGIEQTRDKIAIKKAYTSIVKGKNPEDDPEWFERIHNAYRAALMLASVEIESEEAEAEEDGLSDGEKASSVQENMAEENAAEEDEPAFDFEDINSTLTPVDIEGQIKERIDIFLDDNKLRDAEVVMNLDIRLRSEMAVQLLNYYMLLMSRCQKDVSIWDSFVDEPLVRSVIMYVPFRNTWLGALSLHQDHFRYCLSICDRLLAEDDDTPPKPVKVKTKKDKRVGLIIRIIVSLTITALIPYIVYLITDKVNIALAVSFGGLFISLLVMMVPAVMEDFDDDPLVLLVNDMKPKGRNRNR